MEDLNKNKSSNNSSEDLYSKECEICLKKYQLTDEQLSKLKNGLIGIVDSIINTYLDEYY